MSGSDKISVWIVELCNHLLIGGMERGVPDAKLAEAVRCHCVIEAALVVTLEPVPDVFQVIFLSCADLANVGGGLDLFLERISERLELADALMHLHLGLEILRELLVLPLYFSLESLGGSSVVLLSSI